MSSETVFSPSATKGFRSITGMQVDSLTGLRGFAVLIVVLSHCANKGYLPTFLGRGGGQLGVMLFFVLSGFLMASLYICRSPNRETCVKFLRARAGRVLPLFLAIVALSWWIAPQTPEWPYQILDYPELMRNVFFMEGTRELWAIPIEIQFYGVFFLVWLSSYRPRQFRFIRYIALIASLSAIAALWFVYRKTEDLETGGLYEYVQFFLLGSAMPFILPRIDDRMQSLKSRRGSAMGASLAVLALFFVSFPEIRRSFGIPVVTWYDPVIVLTVSIMFLMSFYGVGLFRVLEARIFVFLGTISYGVYLIHPIVLELVSFRAVEGLNFAAVAVVLGVSTLLGALSFWFFERPLLNLIR